MMDAGERRRRQAKAPTVIKWGLGGLLIAGTGFAGYQFNPERECLFYFGFKRAPERRIYDCALARKTLHELRIAMASGWDSASLTERFTDDIARALQPIE